MAEGKDNPFEHDATFAANNRLGMENSTQFMDGLRMAGGISPDGKNLSHAAATLIDPSGSKYEIGGRIAYGGMGAILQAKDLNIRRTVAMKVLLDPGNSSDDKILRFIEEAQITGQMEHPSIVPVHELGVDSSGNVFYTMKFVKGETLSSILDGITQGKPDVISNYPLNHLLNIFLKVCDAMSFAHAKGVVHRDLKPENIMVGEFGEVLVMDWGIGKVLKAETVMSQDNLSTQIESVRLDDETPFSGAMTMEGKALGTPRYMAPEQACGKVSEIDQRTDIYSLGAILYHILTLSPPVDGETINAILVSVASGQIDPPSKSGRSHRGRMRHLPGGRVPHGLSLVTMKVLSLEKADRYQTVAGLQKDVEAYQGGYPTSAEKAGMLKQMWLMAKRHRTIAVSVIILLVMAMSFGGHAIWDWQRQWGQWIRVCHFDFTGTSDCLDRFCFMDKFMRGQVKPWKQDADGLRMVQLERIWLKEHVGVGNVRVVVEAACGSSPDALELSINSQIRELGQWFAAPPGYSAQFGGFGGTLDLVSRNEPGMNISDLGNSSESSMVKGKKFKVMFERVDDKMQLSVDGVTCASMSDPLPLAGDGFDRVGMDGWQTRKCVRKS